HEPGNFVPKPQDAAGLDADDRNAARSEGGKRCDGALSLPPGLVDETYAEESAPAAERPGILGAGQMHAIPCRGHHVQRRLDILRLEIAIERVGKKRHPFS